MQRDPRDALPVGGALGVAHEPQRGFVGGDADQKPLARRPGAANGVAAHVIEQSAVHALGRAPQRQFAQGRQVAAREEAFERPAGLLGQIDLAVGEALDQVVRRDVDDLDVVGRIEHRVGHDLAYADAGDAGDDVVEAFDMLDVERRQHVDAGRQQLLDIHVALGMAAAGRIGVRKLVDQDEIGTAGEDGVQVHLRKGLPAMRDGAGRNGLQPFDQRRSLLAAMRFDHADDDIDALGLQRPGGQQHLEGLADARRRAQKNPQPPARRGSGGLKGLAMRLMLAHRRPILADSGRGLTWRRRGRD